MEDKNAELSSESNTNTSFTLLGLREVIPDQTGVEQWKELLLSSGGTHLTLQDIKLPEGSTSGGFCYKNSSNVLTRNRFIYWQISNDVLELVEHSLDLNLHGNCLRLRFQGLPILEGTSVHETATSVVVLVTTISSVHRLVLPHPLKQSEPSETSLAAASIFTEASLPWLRDSACHQVVNSTAANAHLPYTAASCLVKSSGEALFALANSSSISLIRMSPSPANAVITSTLKPSSFARLLSGFLPTMLKGAPTQDSEDATTSVTLQPCDDDVLVLTLSKGGKLRVWSATTQDCCLDYDLTDHLGGKAVKQMGSLRHRLRCYSSDTARTKVAVFAVFAKQKSFLVLDLQKSAAAAGGLQVTGQPATLTAQSSHLIDFTLTGSHLYALWSTAQGEFLVQFAPVPAVGEVGGDRWQLDWQTVALEPGVETDVEYDETVTDPKQAYLRAIFKPGRFSVSTLVKALQAFQRSTTNSAGGVRHGASLKTAALKEEIIVAIEAELLEQMDDAEITEEEYIELWHKCWAQFYAYVVQYHMKRPVPVGLLIDETTGLHCLIKKGMISLLRPLDLVESLVLQRGRRWDEEPYRHLSPLFDQHPLSTGLVALLQFLTMVNEKLEYEQIQRFERQMFQLQSADQIAKEIANELLQADALNLLHLMNSAVTSSSICLSLSTLLQQLGVDMSQSVARSHADVALHGDAVAKTRYRFLFSSGLGFSAISESSRQMADLRLALCRDVLIVQQLLILSSENLPLSPVDAAAISSVLLPRTVPLTHAYYALSWICQYPAQTISNALVENNVRQMTVLGFKKAQEAHGWTGNCKNLVGLFLALDGGQMARRMVVQDEDMAEWRSPWLDAFPNLVKAVGQLLWPIGNHVTFMEFLLERFQSLAVQGYVRLLQNWCEWNTCSRKFLKAVALVATGEGDKAGRWILEAAEGIAKEDLLLSMILRHGGDAQQPEQLTMRFYLICVQLLEQAGLSTAALGVAQVALKNGRKDDPLVPTLWSIVAKLHLHLAHYQEAYEAIVSNPDSSQRPESLGRLVNTLLERKQMDVLLTFPYVGLESELEKIIERRARASDIFSMTVYYSFLYAFHVRQGKMRKAAAVMYEQAIRHGCENEASKQVKCLLACLNALRLVSRDEAWLVKPVQDATGRPAVQCSVDVVEYADIEKEYEMSYACLKLGHSVAQLSPCEVVALLTSRHHYESALRIARIFEIEDTSSIVEHLTASCVALSRAGGAGEDEARLWLAENRSTGAGKVSEQAWRLLEKVLERAEASAGQTRCHRAAARKILSLDCTLPYWLAASYKRRNAAELIAVYHGVGALDDAANTALELLDAVLGQGKKCYATAPLQVDSPAVWLPYSVLDRLHLELDANRQNPIYDTLLQDLRRKMQTYFELAERVSRTVVRSAMA